MRNWFLVVSLAMAGVACSRDKKADQLAALEEAYRSGVVTKAEYDAKRAALSGPTQLAALDDAYRSGVLTKGEYEAKRAALAGSGDRRSLPLPPGGCSCSGAATRSRGVAADVGARGSVQGGHADEGGI